MSDRLAYAPDMSQAMQETAKAAVPANFDAFAKTREKTQAIANKIKESNPASAQECDSLLKRQEQERSECLAKNSEEKAKIEAPRKALFTEAATKYVYDKLGIDADTQKNGSVKKLMKGILDSTIVGNAQMLELAVRDPKAVLEALEEICSLEGLKAVAKAIGTSFVNLVSMDAYKTGKSIGELGLTFTGGAFALNMAKKAMRSEMATSIRNVGSKAIRTAAENLKSPVRAQNLNYQIGAIWDTWKSRIPRPMKAADHVEAHPSTISEMKWWFNSPSYSPREYAEVLRNFKVLNTAELLGTMSGIEAFSTSLEWLAMYIRQNWNRMTPEVAEEFFLSIREFKKNVRLLVRDAPDPVLSQPIVTAAEQVDAALRQSIPRLAPKG